MLAASSFAQDAPKSTNPTKATTSKVKKSKKTKATTSVKPAASVPTK